MQVDSSYPPAYREIPDWGFRAELQVEAFDEAVNESNVFLYLKAGPIRFYQIGSPLVETGSWGMSPAARDGDGRRAIDPADLPPIVYSEILRDFGLFLAGAALDAV